MGQTCGQSPQGSHSIGPLDLSPGLAQCFDQTSVFQCDHSLGGKSVEQTRVLRYEATATAAVIHRQRADHTLLSCQRHNENLIRRHLGEPFAHGALVIGRIGQRKSLRVAQQNLVHEVAGLRPGELDLLQTSRNLGVARKESLPAKSLPTGIEEKQRSPVEPQIFMHRVQQQFHQSFEFHFLVEIPRQSIDCAEFLQQPSSLALQRIGLDRPTQGQTHILGLPRLWDVPIDTAVVDRVPQDFDVAVGGDQNSNCVWGEVANLGQKFHPSHAGHTLIRQNHGDRILVQNFHPGLGGCGGQNREFMPEGQLKHA